MTDHDRDLSEDDSNGENFEFDVLWEAAMGLDICGTQICDDEASVFAEDLTPWQLFSVGVALGCWHNLIKRPELATIEPGSSPGLFTLRIQRVFTESYSSDSDD